MARVLVAQKGGWPEGKQPLIPPSGDGGIAGGEKYRCGEVFYKFAETRGIYPDDAAAHKAAALEITAPDELRQRLAEIGRELVGRYGDGS